jgi:hypothetical protein
MTMHYIIEQVDAYLAVLHQAREILLNDGERMPATKSTRRKSGLRTNARRLTIRVAGPKTRSTAGLKDQEPIAKFSKNRVLGTIPPKTPSPIVSHSEPTTTMSSNEGTLAREIVKRVAAQRRTTFNRFASGRPTKSRKLEPKLTTALFHPIRSNVVVISAEQLRLERERSVKPVEVRPRSPGSGATGRLAFEALFGQ